jgi:DNA-directed RNA polymerase subunit RPC12/RpoP
MTAEINKDEMVACPSCNSDACYKNEISKGINSYVCFGCGFLTNDAMKEGFNFDEYEANMPQLYVDLKKIDSEDRVWYPMTINVKEKGVVFAYGTSKDNWQWTGIKNRELTEQEQKELANKGITYKSDASSMKHFDKDFIEALDYINYFGYAEY